MSLEPRVPDSWFSEGQRLVRRYAVPGGIAITFAMFALIVVPAVVRERQSLPRPPSDQPAVAPTGWLDQAEAPPSKGKDLPPIDPATVMTSTPALLARGETLFKQNCASCHGDAGHGDGPAATGLNPPPRNFTQPSGWTLGHRITDVFTSVSKGIKGTAMSAFDYLSASDRMALVHYVRSLGRFEHAAEDPKATEELANQFRTKGMRIPNRIPVSMAINKMVAEADVLPPVALPPADDASPSASLVRAMVADPARAGRTVAQTRTRDLDTVARAWVAGAPANGFAPSVAALDREQWGNLVAALLGTQSGPGASTDRGTSQSRPGPGATKQEAEGP